MKRHAFDRLDHTHDPEKWHHRNFPTVWPWVLSGIWTFMHLFMPFLIHYLTDKYEGKWHRVIVDTIYAATTMTLLFVNVGIGIWFYLYSTPADIDLRITTSEYVTSGQPMEVQVTYGNPYRTIQNAQMHIDLPPGMVAASEGDHATVDALLGTVKKGSVETIPVSGVIFGNVGETYTVRVVMVYTYLGREQQEVAFYHFSVKDSTLTVSVDLPEVAVYGREVSGAIRYTNNSTIARKNAEVQLLFPEHFILTGIAQDGIDLQLQSDNNSVTIDRIAGSTGGVINFRGYFSLQEAREHELLGDQEVAMNVAMKAAIDSPLARTDAQFTQEIASGSIPVVNPRATLSAASPRAIHFGDQWIVTLAVTNVGDTPITEIDLSAEARGVSISATQAQYTTFDGERVVSTGTVNLVGTGTALPRIPKINAGKTGTITLRIPTFTTTEQRVQAFLTASGSVYAPEIETRIPLLPQSADTKFHSQVSLEQEALYYSPEGEQLGFGPLPLQPWKQTSFRVLFGLQNINNDLSNVHVFAKLSPQAEWSDLYSYSAGTAMTFDARQKTVHWAMPDLSPQSQKYGGQFEAIVTPNILQVNKVVPILESVRITATDAFTGETFTIQKNQLNTPVKVLK